MWSLLGPFLIAPNPICSSRALTHLVLGSKRMPNVHIFAVDCLNLLVRPGYRHTWKFCARALCRQCVSNNFCWMRTIVRSSTSMQNMMSSWLTANDTCSLVNLLFRRERRDRREEAVLFKLYRRRQQYNAAAAVLAMMLSGAVPAVGLYSVGLLTVPGIHTHCSSHGPAPRGRHQGNPTHYNN